MRYDGDSAHVLNAVAADVWRAWDGQRDLEALQSACGLDKATVIAALDGLRECGLLLGDPAEQRGAQGPYTPRGNHDQPRALPISDRFKNLSWGAGLHHAERTNPGRVLGLFNHRFGEFPNRILLTGERRSLPARPRLRRAPGCRNRDARRPRVLGAR